MIAHIYIVIKRIFFLGHRFFMGFHPCGVYTRLFFRKRRKRIFRPEGKSVHFYENTFRSRTIHVLRFLSSERSPTFFFTFFTLNVFHNFSEQIRSYLSIHSYRYEH